MGESEQDVRVYEVKTGDTLCGIAARFGYITPTQLARINRLSMVGFGLPPVFSGQKLVIPTLAKGAIEPAKFRRAPGSALRVRTSSNEQQTNAHDGVAINVGLVSDFYTYRSRAYSSYDRTTTDERRFVKVPVQRVLSTNVLIDGVLLITPDTLCFDAAETAAATDATRTQQSLAESPGASSPSAESPGASSTSAESTSRLSSESSVTPSVGKKQPTLNVCLQLSSLVSMTTLRSLDGISSGNHSDSSSSQLLDDQMDNEPDSVLRTQLDTVNLQDTSDLSTDDAVEQTYDVIQLEDVPPDNTHMINPVAPTSPRHDSEITKEDDSDKFYILQIIEVPQNRNAHIRHRFKISVSQITDVLSFLLHAGIESASTQKSEVSFPRHSQNDSRRSSDPSTGHRSLIVEALENMENSSILPSLYEGTSTILTDSMLEELASNLPTHWITSNLRFVYSTEQDGYSLSTVYRKSKEVEGGILLVVRDTTGTVFGAVMSERMHPSKHFYGTGETFVFHWSPTFIRYDWTRKNSFFMRGSLTSFQIGGQSGRNAIWFDGALKYGRSEPTDTFDNPVLSGVLRALQFDKSYTQFSLPDPTSSDSAPTTPQQSPIPSPSYGLDSVPFIIDSIEVWELVS